MKRQRIKNFRNANENKLLIRHWTRNPFYFYDSNRHSVPIFLSLENQVHKELIETFSIFTLQTAFHPKQTPTNQYKYSRCSKKVISFTCSFLSCVFSPMAWPEENNNGSIKAPLEKYKRRITIKTDFRPILNIHLLHRRSLYRFLGFSSHFTLHCLRAVAWDSKNLRCFQVRAGTFDPKKSKRCKQIAFQIRLKDSRR